MRVVGGNSWNVRFLPRDRGEGYDGVLRHDAYLTFNPEFEELVMAELEKDPRLGIAGPTLYEPSGTRWHEVPAPSFHTRGAAKLYSSACFAAIGGLEARLGWGTIHAVPAVVLWVRARHLPRIRAPH